MRYSPAIALVNLPNAPPNGVARWNDIAWCQSTLPANTGATAETKARKADPVAMRIARLVTLRNPARLASVKPTTIAIAMGVIGTPGRYQSWIADADSNAVRPQVGTHPHQ